MKSFVQFLKEDSNGFLDLNAAMSKAKADGYVLDDAKGFSTGVSLSKVPPVLQKGEQALWRYERGDEGELGIIRLFEPAPKKVKSKVYTFGGKGYVEVDIWRLKTAEDKARDAKDKEVADAEKAHFRDHIKPVELAWIKQVYDAAVDKLRRGKELVFTTMTHQFPLSKPEHLRFVQGQGLQSLRRYKNGKPEYMWIAMAQIEQLAGQLGVPPLKKY